MRKLLIVAMMALCSCASPSGEQAAGEVEAVGFPYTVTAETAKQNNLSCAVKRAFTDYMAYRPEDNPLYTNFFYTKVKGLDYNGGDGTLSRRDPSKIIKVGDLYYVWYTKRDTKCAPIGAHNAAKCDDTTPSTDWDLSEIWYSTSKDGYTWEEQGVAVPRPAKPTPGHRSVSTPDILVWKGKYYLYYQAFSEPSGLKGDYCPVSLSYADSPRGPWTHVEGEIIPTGKEGQWDQFAVHDPYPMVHNGKIYLYYKSAFNRPDKLWVSAGLVTADDPKGPFTRHPKNPLFNAGHETTLFPFKEGVAAILIRDGLEHNTVQYAADWESFKLASVVELPPTAGAPYVADAFTDTKDGQGIEWGLSHFTDKSGKFKTLERFDCNLTQDLGDPIFKTTKIDLPAEVYFIKKMNQKVVSEREKRFKLE